MPRYSEERKAAVLKKLLPLQNRSVVSVAADEGIFDVTLYSWLKIADFFKGSVDFGVVLLVL